MPRLWASVTGRSVEWPTATEKGGGGKIKSSVVLYICIYHICEGDIHVKYFSHFHSMAQGFIVTFQTPEQLKQLLFIPLQLPPPIWNFPSELHSPRSRKARFSPASIITFLYRKCLILPSKVSRFYFIRGVGRETVEQLNTSVLLWVQNMVLHSKLEYSKDAVPLTPN